MKNQFLLFFQCIFGPKLYQTYPTVFSSANQQLEHLYIKNIAEILCDQIFLVLKIFSGIIRIIWPICLFYIYQKGFLTIEYAISCLPSIICLMIIIIYFVLLRGIARWINPVYEIFINEYIKVKRQPSTEIRQKFLSKFDFSLSHWQPDYVIQSSAVRKVPLIYPGQDNLIDEIKPTICERLCHYPLILLGYLCVNIFGRRLMFPGSIQIIRHMMTQALFNGRTNLIVSYHAQRSMLLTADGNRIDTMFVDRRSTDQGQTLIITCEGNAGFYEVGCMTTPLEAGYSVLGWNRPGFGESSGYPGVISEINSIDAVMHYALEKLHFPLNQIIIFAWSIGGYSACWTAVHYQNIQGLILDAIFDDILPLAQRQMPLSLSKFVEKTIRYYLNLNNIELLKHYHGPFYLIRRIRDEVMNIIPGEFQSNRANNFLLSILPYRYPLIFNNDEILLLFHEYLSANRKEKSLLRDRFCSNRDQLQDQIDLYRLENVSLSYPCQFGEYFSFEQRQAFAIYLIDQYLVDFHSQHCTTLLQKYFFIPSRCV